MAPGDAVEILLAEHEAQDLRVDVQTGCAGWSGERLDVAWAIDVLHPLATRIDGHVRWPPSHTPTEVPHAPEIRDEPIVTFERT